jgi:hypothetical protein
MKCILCYNLKFSYDKQDEHKGNDSHTFIRNLVYHNVDDLKLKRKFISDFDSLKSKRKKADYQNEIITENECLIAMEEAKRIITYLKTSFGTLKLEQQ